MAPVTVISLAVVVLLTLLVISVSKVSDIAPSKYSPFECGFEEFSSSRVPFSLKFFMVVLIFLIFDVEIVLILVLPSVKHFSLFHSWWSLSMVLVFILVVGLVWEWAQGVFEWSEC